MTEGKWRYFNWTRYELRLIDTLDTELLEHHLAGPQPVPAGDPARLGRAGLDAEDLVRLPGGRAHLALRHREDRSRSACASRSATSRTRRLLVEFQYYLEFTQPSGLGLVWTNNIWRLNFKVSTDKSALKLLAGGFDD